MVPVAAVGRPTSANVADEPKFVMAVAAPFTVIEN